MEASPWLLAYFCVLLGRGGVAFFGLPKLLFSPRIPNTLEGGTREESAPLSPVATPEFLESETCEKWKRPFR